MERILIDSGPLTALFDKDHEFHSWAVDVLKKSSAELITSIISVHETLAALSFSKAAQLDFLTWVEQAITVAPVTEDDITSLYELIRRPPSYQVDFSDSSLLLLSEKLDIGAVITLGKAH